MRRPASAADRLPDTPGELKARALRLLARREHTRAELQRKLGPYAGSAEAIQALLDALVAKGQLSEARYASERTRQLSRKYGSSRIGADLRAKGVDEETADRSAGEAAAGDLERAREILARKYRVRADTREERARRMRFLLSRGFDTDLIRRLVRED